MANESEEVRNKNAPSTLELALAHTREGAEAIRRGGGIFASTQLAAEIEALRRFADNAGILSGFERLDAPPDAFGFEHEVWFPDSDASTPRVWKATYGNTFGTLPDSSEASPTGYFERLLPQNEAFGDDIRLEGIWECRVGVLRVVTSQPAVAGRPAEPGEIRSFFSDSGFQLMEFAGRMIWSRTEDSLICSDTHGGNILVTETGALVAIDVPIMRAPPGICPGIDLVAM